MVYRTGILDGQNITVDAQFNRHNNVVFSIKSLVETYLQRFGSREIRRKDVAEFISKLSNFKDQVGNLPLDVTAHAKEQFKAIDYEIVAEADKVIQACAAIIVAGKATVQTHEGYLLERKLDAQGRVEDLKYPRVDLAALRALMIDLNNGIK